MSALTDIQPGEFEDAMPDMDEERFEALKDSIREHGLEYPILVTEEGTIVDGHHRYRACQELGIEPETIVVGESDIEQALRTNLAGRDLTDGSKRRIVETYLEEHYEGERSQREIAGDLGVSQTTVRRAINDLKERGGLSHLHQYTTEEKRQQVREYIENNPGGSNREVARSIEADVDHTTVGRWREEFEVEDETDEWYDTRRCRAITKAGGQQCDSRMTPLCGNHEDSNSLVRVDEFDAAPNADLRDELMEYCHINGQRAFALAVLADDIEACWERVTSLQPASVGPFDWSANQLASWAEDIATHPDLDVEWSHPLAAERCVAVTDNGDQCPNGSYGTSLLCGMHQDVDDIETVLERPAGLLEELRTVSVDGFEHWVVEERGEDLVVITPDWGVERISAEGVVDTEPNEAVEFRLGCDKCAMIFTATGPHADCPECGKKHPDNLGFVGDADLAERIEAADLPDNIDTSRLDAATAQEVLEEHEDDDPAEDPDDPGAHEGIQYVDDVDGLTAVELEKKGIAPSEAFILAERFDSIEEIATADLSEIDGIYPSTIDTVDRIHRGGIDNGLAKIEGALRASEEHHFEDPTAPYFQLLVETITDDFYAEGWPGRFTALEEIAVDPVAIGTTTTDDTPTEPAPDPEPEAEPEATEETVCIDVDDLRDLTVLLDRAATSLEEEAAEEAKTKIEDARDITTQLLEGEIES